ncbi:putative glycine-rich cell wall structural protein 1 [Dendrobium catenatum]|uniref:putative glycine-rich cell wall structural protein 1 n=1 Tax=Dendrobium catenatum TaxID=906689 RepID=UPI0009F60DC2|nr:putative glycine-rich cell wall structural protein 1 [Dendrobium catenatum]
MSAYYVRPYTVSNKLHVSGSQPLQISFLQSASNIAKRINIYSRSTTDGSGDGGSGYGGGDGGSGYIWRCANSAINSAHSASTASHPPFQKQTMATSNKLKALALLVLLSISFCLSFARSLKQAGKPKSSSGYHLTDDGNGGENVGFIPTYVVGEVGGNSDGGSGYGGGYGGGGGDDGGGYGSGDGGGDDDGDGGYGGDGGGGDGGGGYGGGNGGDRH